MNTFLKINWILTIVLSLATGVFKILQQEEDIALFDKIGFNSVSTTLLGIVQLIGGILLIIPKTRKLGAYVMIPTFVIASVAVFANEMYVFGIVSLLFIVMAVAVVIMVDKNNDL